MMPKCNLFVAACSFILLLRTSAAFFCAKTTLSRNERLCSISPGRHEIGTRQLNNSDDLEDDTTSPIRPLHQNWWPVAALTSIDPSRPNAIQVLGKALVAAKSNSSWKVLDDRCSHRFAPLSEGRLLASGSLQCSYHGWEFDTHTGVCTKLPQMEEKEQRCYSTNVSNSGARWYALGVDGSNVTGPCSANTAADFSVFTAASGKAWERSMFHERSSVWYRTFGENLMDLSHLPFSHHSVGGLRREQGGPLPTRMLSKREREDAAAWEKQHNPDCDPVLPRYQVEIINASQYDPTIMRFAKPGMETSCHIGFHDPCHVRIRRIIGERLGHVELFWCPLSEGRSRVFLFNIFRSPPVPENGGLRARMKQVTPGALKAKLAQTVFQKLTDPRRPSAHLLNHEIFDGDGIFLHKQGNRMRQDDLTFRDYSTPTSADTLLSAYRRFLESAARKTRELASDAVADAAVGQKQYDDDLPRSVLLDRYNSHTKNCPICLASLQKSRRSKTRTAFVKTALQGVLGTSIFSFVGLLSLESLPFAVKVTTRCLINALLGRVGIMIVVSALGVLAATRKERKLNRTIDLFFIQRLCTLG